MNIIEIIILTSFKMRHLRTLISQYDFHENASKK